MQTHFQALQLLWPLVAASVVFAAAQHQLTQHDANRDADADAGNAGGSDASWQSKSAVHTAVCA
jgi:hypothetical protein